MVETSKAMPRSLNSLQVLRGVAATMVVFYHTYLILAQPEYIGQEIFGGVASRGWLGVNLFFVLSGFIILHAHSKDIGRPEAIKNYAIKRFIRVYPIYWVFMIAYMLAASAGLGYPNFEWSTVNLISAFTLIKFAEPLTLPLRVAWTLFYEITFYAMFVLFLINRKLAIAAFSAWAVVILISVFLFDKRDMGLLNVWNLYFPAGMLAYLGFRYLSPRLGPAVLLAGIVLLGVMAATDLGARATLAGNYPTSLLALALPCIMIILGATLWERQARWNTPRVLNLLGEASFSIYLVHSGVLSLAAILYVKLQLTFISPVACFFLAAGASVVAGVIAHLLIEIPVLERLRRFLLKRTQHRPSSLATVAEDNRAQEKV